MIVDFIHGIFIGLGASIPLGPVGIVCIQRTLSKGRLSGLVSGGGAAVTDTSYAAIAFLSLSFIETFITKYHYEVMIAGGLIVAGFGLFALVSDPLNLMNKNVRQNGNKKRYVADFFSTVLMTISNPGAFILMLGVMAFFGVSTDEVSRLASSVILLGVLTGAAAWWYLLTTVINIFRNKFQLRQLMAINRVSGFIILVLGIISFVDGIINVINK